MCEKHKTTPPTLIDTLGVYGMLWCNSEYRLTMQYIYYIIFIFIYSYQETGHFKWVDQEEEYSLFFKIFYYFHFMLTHVHTHPLRG